MQKLLESLADWAERVLPAGIGKRLRPFFTVQFLIFVVIGGVNTLSTAVFAAGLDILHPAGRDSRFNFVLGYLAGLVLSFFLNTRFTFRQKPTLRRFIRFPVSYIPNFIIQYLCVWLFTALSLNQTLAYLLAAAAGIPVTFLTMKFFVY